VKEGAAFFRSSIAFLKLLKDQKRGVRLANRKTGSVLALGFFPPSLKVFPKGLKATARGQSALN
jgi:hypothetical protein